MKPKEHKPGDTIALTETERAFISEMIAEEHSLFELLHKVSKMHSRVNKMIWNYIRDLHPELKDYAAHISDDDPMCILITSYKKKDKG